MRDRDTDPRPQRGTISATGSNLDGYRKAPARTKPSRKTTHPEHVVVVVESRRPACRFAALVRRSDRNGNARCLAVADHLIRSVQWEARKVESELTRAEEREE